VITDLEAMEHRVTWPDIFNGRAEVFLPPDAVIALAERAGAPWNEKDPDAKLSPIQKEIITAEERTIIVFGGSRGGKSIAGACIALAQLMVPNSIIALIGLNYEHCSKEFGYIWQGFFRLFPKSAATEAQFITRSPHFSMRLSTVWGSSVRVFSTTSKEGAQLLGNEFDLAILCEAAQVVPDVYNTKVERALLGRAKKRHDGYVRKTGRAVLLTTPKQLGGASYDIYNRALHRTKGKLEKLRASSGIPWMETMYFLQASVRELNPSYPEEHFEHARRTLPRYSFEEQFLGLAVVRSGLVYSSFKEDLIVLEKHQMPALDKCVFGVGIDTGTNFAAVLAAITPEGKVYVLGDVKEIGQNTAQNAESVLAMVERCLQGITPNPREAVGLWVVDVNSQSIPDLELHLGVEFFYQKYDVLESLGHLDMRMGNGEIFISDNCEMLLNEMRGYRYRTPKDKFAATKDKPVGEDHALDAFRYLLMQLFEHGPPPPETVVWTVDQMLEKEREEMLRPNLTRDLARMQSQHSRALLGAW
jgi:hypothetical protein